MMNFLSLIFFDILMWIFIQFNYWWLDEFLYISNIKCEKLKLSVEGITMPVINTILELGHYMWKIWAQCWHDFFAGCQHYSGADVFCMKFRAQCYWDHYAGDRYYFGALRHYMSKLDKFEPSIVGITTPVIDTILELRRCGFSVDHIISLALRHWREII